MADAEMSLKDLLRTVKVAREGDPQFESVVADFADAEAALAVEDPVEGRPTLARDDKGVGKSVGTPLGNPDQTSPKLTKSD